MEFTISTKDGWVFSTDKLRLVEIYAILEDYRLKREDKVFLCGIVDAAMEEINASSISAYMREMVAFTVGFFESMKDEKENTPQRTILIYRRLVSYSREAGYDEYN